MGKIQDKFFNRVIEGDVEFQENEQAQVQSLMEKGEPMSGYSTILPESNTERAVNPIYVGVCKNGNKITFVIFGTITKLNADITPDNAQAYFGFNIPSSVGAKLYPFEVGGGNAYLDLKDIKFVAKEDYEKKTVNIDFVKANNSQVGAYVSCYYLTANKEYYFRLEETFLLSDNLIPNA